MNYDFRWIKKSDASTGGTQNPPRHQVEKNECAGPGESEILTRKVGSWRRRRANIDLPVLTGNVTKGIRWSDPESDKYLTQP